MADHRAFLKGHICPSGIGLAIPVHVESPFCNLSRLNEILLVLNGIHHFRYSSKALCSVLEVIGDLTVSFPFLRGDQYHTITGSGTVNGGRCPIFQHLHRFDVIRVDATNIPGNPSVDHIQRVAGAIGAHTTDTHRG